MNTASRLRLRLRFRCWLNMVTKQSSAEDAVAAQAVGHFHCSSGVPIIHSVHCSVLCCHTRCLHCLLAQRLKLVGVMQRCWQRCWYGNCSALHGLLSVLMSASRKQIQRVLPQILSKHRCLLHNAWCELLQQHMLLCTCERCVV